LNIAEDELQDDNEKTEEIKSVHENSSDNNEESKINKEELKGRGRANIDDWNKAKVTD